MFNGVHHKIKFLVVSSPLNNSSVTYDLTSRDSEVIQSRTTVTGVRRSGQSSNPGPPGPFCESKSYEDRMGENLLLVGMFVSEFMKKSLSKDSIHNIRLFQHRGSHTRGLVTVDIVNP